MGVGANVSIRLEFTQHIVIKIKSRKQNFYTTYLMFVVVIK